MDEMFSYSARLDTKPGREVDYPESPYVVIYDFFGDDTVLMARKWFRNILEAAFTEEVAKEDAIKSLSWLRNCEKLIAAASEIYHKENLAGLERKETESALVATHIRYFHKKAGKWKLCPQYLHPLEWRKPRLAIKDFIEYQPLRHWKLVLHCIAQAAICYESIFTTLPECERIFRDCLHLYRLIDAAWVIRVVELPSWKA